MLHDCAASAPEEQADRIREAYALFAHRGFRGGQSRATMLNGKTLEVLLALGAYESVVLALMGDNSAFMLSRGANGNCLASVALPHGPEEMVAEGSTLALALLCAHLSALLANGEKTHGKPAGHLKNEGQQLN
jgi:hypothetical protein